ALGSGSSQFLSRRSKRARSQGNVGQCMGVDVHNIRPLSWIRAVLVLPRLFSRFLRRKALRVEGGFAAHCGVHAATLVPKLVSAALPVRLRGISLREELRTHADTGHNC